MMLQSIPHFDFPIRQHWMKPIMSLGDWGFSVG